MRLSSGLTSVVIVIFALLILPGGYQNRTSPAALKLAPDGWDLALLDTGRDAGYLNETEKDILLIMNAVRTDPQRFSDLYVKEYRSWYKGSRLRIPGQTELMTAEGISAVDECIPALQKSRPAGILQPSQGMSRAAREHAEWQRKTGNIGHTGEGGSDPWFRMNKYGIWLDTSGENISYGFNTGYLVIMQLLVDDGVAGRGHRTNIMSPDFHVTGIGFAEHPAYSYVAVINYAGNFRDR